MLALRHEAIIELVFETIGADGIMRAGIAQPASVRGELFDAGGTGKCGEMFGLCSRDVMQGLEDEIHVRVLLPRIGGLGIRGGSAYFT